MHTEKQKVVVVNKGFDPGEYWACLAEDDLAERRQRERLGWLERRRRLGDAALAEDLTGEVFLRVLQAIRAGRAWQTSFRAWLYRIAHNLVVDHYRRRPPAPPVPVDEDLASDGHDDPAAIV